MDTIIQDLKVPGDAHIRSDIVAGSRSPFQLAPRAPHPTDRSHRGAEV